MSIEGLILAAGLSTRTGSFKMGLQLGERTILQRTIDSMLVFCSKIIVVGGNQYDCILKLTKEYNNVEVVFNKNYKMGMFSSIQKGIQFIKGDWLFFTPGDYPFISHQVYMRLLEASKNNNYNIYVPAHGGKKGHPVLINGSLIKEISGKPADYNLKTYINNNGFKKVEVDDDGIFFDIDTEEDYRKACERYQGRPPHVAPEV